MDCGAIDENNKYQFVVWHDDIKKAETIRLRVSMGNACSFAFVHFRAGQKSGTNKFTRSSALAIGAH